MLRFNGLWNTILTLECWAQEMPLVFQAEEDYGSGLGKKRIWSLVIIKGGKGKGKGRGWRLKEVSRVAIKFTNNNVLTISPIPQSLVVN